MLTGVLINKQNAYTNYVLEVEMWATVHAINPTIRKDAINAEIKKTAKERHKFVLCLVPLCALLKALCDAREHS